MHILRNILPVLILLAPLVSSAQGLVYSARGLTLRINSTRTKDYNYKNVHGKMEDRYIWDVEWEIKNSTSRRINLQFILIKGTIKCDLGSGSPEMSFTNDCIGTVLLNEPHYLKPGEVKTVKVCTDTSCETDLEINWDIASWTYIDEEGRRVTIHRQEGYVYGKASGGGEADPKTTAVMNEIRRTYDGYMAEYPKYAVPRISNANSYPPNYGFLNERASDYEALIEKIRIAELTRRTFLQSSGTDNKDCLEYYKYAMLIALKDYKAWRKFLGSFSYDTEARLNYSESDLREKRESMYIALDVEIRDLKKNAVEAIKLMDCPVSYLIEKNWDEKKYALSAQSSQASNKTNPITPRITVSEPEQGSGQGSKAVQGEYATKSANSLQGSGSEQSSQASNIESEESFKTLLNAGKLANKNNDYSKAIHYLSYAIKVRPDLSEGYYQRANARHSLRLFGSAIEDYNSAEKLGDRSFYLYYGRGMSYHSQKMYNEAISDYSAANAISPRNAGPLHLRGISYEQQKEFQKAFNDLKNVLLLEPNREGAKEDLERLTAKVGEMDSSTNKFHIENVTGQELKFELSTNGKDWTLFSLNEKSSSNYWFPNNTQGKFRMSSKGNTVEYIVRNGVSYFLNWNDIKECWDLFIAK